MVEKSIIFIYILFFVSMVCALSVAVRLFLSGKNYLIAVLAAGMALLEIDVLTSIIWINNFGAFVPRGYCIFQGLALHFTTYLQMTAALCFSIQIYQLLVYRKRGITHLLQRVYIYCIVGIPIIMTIILAIVAVRTDAIQPFVLNCDIKNPVWVRLIGYSGVNFFLSFVGVFLSVRASYEVFTHLDRFKTSLSTSGGLNLSSNSNTSNTTSITNTTNISDDTNNTNNTSGGMLESNNLPNPPNPPNPPNRNLQQTYNMTRAAAIRMVLFSFGFALINFFASIQTILLVLKGEKDESKGLRGNDLVGALMGILIYIVFGLPRNMKHLLCLD